MKFTKKCESTRVKINVREKLDTKRRNKRCPSAGIFCTSSAGAVISLIFRNKIVSTASSLTLMFLFCGLIGIFSLTGTTDMLGLGGSAYAEDSINLNIDTNNLSLDTMSTSTTGNFATSSNMNISVSTTSENGYTLSMQSATGSTSLVNTTDSSKTINSIPSSVTPTNYADDAYASANNLNNTWGYLPSKYNSAANTNFLPLPTDSAQIIEITDSANPTANTYTLSFGTRVNNETAVGSYKNDSFVIIAIANIVPLTINYNANGGYFGSSTSTTLNTVAYDATSEGGTETVTKYSHTSNINDQGVASGTYPASQATKDVVTIPGATQLNVQIYYATRSSSYAAAYAFTGEYTGSISSSTTGYLKKYTSGQGTTKETANTDTFTVTGDTVTFGFYSSYRSSRYYGYYAIVTAEVDSTTYSKTAISGSYATPNDSDRIFVGWTENQDGSGAVYADESEVSTKLPYVNGDPAVTLYAKWKYPEIQNIAASYCTTAAKTVEDSRDGQQYIIQRLADGNCWMMANLNLGATTLTNDLTRANTNIAPNTTITTSTFNGWKKTSGSGTYTSAEYIPVSGTDSTSRTPYGTLYNYCAVSAGTVCYSSSSGGRSTGYDLCPAGWRMPTGGSNGEFQTLYNSRYNTYAKMRASIANGGAAFALPGSFYNDPPSYQAMSGSYWSSTLYGTTNVYTLAFPSTDVVHTDDNISRNAGMSLRCIMKTPSMQSATSESLAAAMPNVGDTTILRDARDDEEYLIGKFADGNYWMLDNLRLGGSSTMNLTPSDTNIPSNFTLPASTTTGFDWSIGFTTAAVNADYKNTTTTSYGAGSGKIGNYYNFCAASAGTYCYPENEGTENAEYDICPAGWRMPTGGSSGEYKALYDTYHYDDAKFKNDLSTPLSGNIYGGSVNDQGKYGHFWSSTTTTSTGNYMYSLFVLSQGASPTNNSQRPTGISVRCLLGS